MHRAVISVSDKTDLVPFSRGLTTRGYEIVSTGGTAKALTAGGIPATSISDVTGFPEIMGADAVIVKRRPDSSPGFISADDANDVDLSGERPHVPSDVSRAAHTELFPIEFHDRNGRFGRDSTDTAENEVIEHQVADDQDTQAR